MLNECPKVPKSNLISKYTSSAIACFVFYIAIMIVGIYKKYNLYFSYFELFIFLLFLIYNWFYLLGFLIISIFFNLIRVSFVLGILIQNLIPINNSSLFKYIYYCSSILLDIITIKILFEIRKEGKALLREKNEGTELKNIPDNSTNYITNKKQKEKKEKKGYIPFSGKGTVVG